MRDGLREPGVRAVMQVVCGALLVLAGLINLGTADGRRVPFVVSLFVLVGSVVVMVGGVRTYRRLNR